MVMDAPHSQAPLSDNKPMAAHAWLLQEHQCLAEKVGEPLFVTIRLVYDGFAEVDVETFTGRNRMAGGDSLYQSRWPRPSKPCFTWVKLPAWLHRNWTVSITRETLCYNRSC